MKKTTYQIITKKGIKDWEQKKAEEWGKNADFWIKIIRGNLDPFRLVITNKAILESLKREEGLKILDAGCGEGYLCRILARRKHRLSGIDFNPKLIAAAKKLEKEKTLGIEYFVGDFRKTNFPPSSFDAILSHQTIHELENPETALKEFYRILKRKGRLIFLFLHPCFDFKPEDFKNTPLSLWYFNKVKIKKGSYSVGGIKSVSPYFYLHLPLSQWLNLLVKSGFSIVNVKEPHPSLRLIKKDKWWRQNFSRPRFILIEALKN